MTLYVHCQMQSIYVDHEKILGKRELRCALSNDSITKDR